MRGLRTKLQNLFIDSFNINNQIIVFTETWLNSTFLNTEILCNKYNVFRRDRKTYGGGVLIAIASNLYSEPFVLDCMPDIEFLAVIIKLRHKRIIVTCSYIPPSSPDYVYIQHAETIKSVAQTLNVNDSFIVTGDFNMPSICWKFLPEEKYYVQTKLKDDLSDFFNIIYDLGLYQVNEILNDYSKLLDLIFINDKDDCYIKQTTPITSPEDKFHPTIQLNLYNTFQQVLPIPRRTEKEFVFKQTNYELLKQLISNTNWFIHY